MDKRATYRKAGRQLQGITSKRLPPLLPRRLLEAQERERQLIIAELAKIKGLMPLLMKRRNGGRWTAAERHELMQQMNLKISVGVRQTA